MVSRPSNASGALGLPRRYRPPDGRDRSLHGRESTDKQVRTGIPAYSSPGPSMSRPSRPKAIRSPRSRRGDGPGRSWRSAKGSQLDAEAFYRERRAKKREEQAAALRRWDRLFAGIQRQIPDPLPPPAAQPVEARKEPAPSEKPKKSRRQRTSLRARTPSQTLD